MRSDSPILHRTTAYFLKDNASSFSRFFCRAMELEIPSCSLVNSSSFCLYSLWLSWEAENTTHYSCLPSVKVSAAFNFTCRALVPRAVCIRTGVSGDSLRAESAPGDAHPQSQRIYLQVHAHPHGTACSCLSHGLGLAPL